MALERSEKPTDTPASASAIGFGSPTLSSFSTGPPPARTIRARGETWSWCCAGCAWTRTARGLAWCSVGCDHARAAATKAKVSIESSAREARGGQHEEPSADSQESTGVLHPKIARFRISHFMAPKKPPKNIIMKGPGGESRFSCCCCETHNARALRTPKHGGRYRNGRRRSRHSLLLHRPLIGGKRGKE